MENNDEEKKEHIDKEYLQKILDSIETPLCVINVDSYELELSNKAAKKIAITPDSPLCFDFTKGIKTPCDPNLFPCPLVKIKESKKPVRLNHTITGENREKRYYEIHGYPIFDKEGKVVRIVESIIEITDKITAEEQIRSLAQFPGSSPNPLLQIDEDCKITYANEASKSLLDTMAAKVGSILPSRLKERIGRIYEKGEAEELEIEGMGRTFSLLIIPSFEGDSFFVYGRDISDEKWAVAELQLAAKVFENSIEGIMITDTKGMIEKVNPSFSMITGYAAGEVLGQNPRILKSSHHDDLFYKKMWEDLREKGKWQGEIWNRRKNGESYPEWKTIVAIRNSEGQATHYASVFVDITEIKRCEEEIRFDAYHDPLTGLPNRVLMMDRLKQAIHKAARKKEKVALFFIDLDHFKEVNDSLGHDKGDLLLQGTAGCLVGAMREEDTVSRLGGDEFVAMATVTTLKEGLHMAERIKETLEKPFMIKGEQVPAGGSIGIAFYPDDGTGAEEILRKADIAMYRVKKLGGGAYRPFREEMGRELKKKMEMKKRIKKGLDADEFYPYYQPRIDPETGKVVAVEALARWCRSDSPRCRLPEEFLPLAEETGLIVDMGRKILRQACGEVGRWHENGWKDLVLSVNLSAREWGDRKLSKEIASILRDSPLPARALSLEVSEETAIADLEESSRTMGVLSNLGVQLHLDNFGAGYSSWKALKVLPLSGLNLHHSFVKNIAGEEGKPDLFPMVMAMSRALNVKVTATGVESGEQLSYVKNQQCHAVQGNFFSKPLSGQDAESYLGKHH